MIQSFNPNFEKEEILNIIQTISDNWVTEGKKTEELEKRLAEYFKCKRVLMMPNGTLAIFAALKICGIKPGDEVIVPDFTFFGTASAAILAGGIPVLVDVNKSDFNIDVSKLKESLSSKTKFIVPVHIYGQSCNMTEVMNFAKENNLTVVEDAAQGMGVTFGEQHVGTFGKIGCMSFFADKTITTGGEGGCLIINDEKLIDESIYFKNQGRLHRGTFIHTHMGYNFRITDLQSAIGLAQFNRLDQIIKRKKEIQKMYYDRLSNCKKVYIPEDNKFGRSVPFRVCILTDNAKSLADFLKECEINTRTFFYPLHMQPVLDSTNSIVRKTPIVSVSLFDKGLCLPSSISITDDEIRYICDCIIKFTERN